MTISDDAGAIEDATFVLALRARGVRDTDVLRAMERVPRECFAPARHRIHARRDIALPLACGQTMTAPVAVAAMLTALAVAPGGRVLEIGTGSGYVTALLLGLGAARVRSIERYTTLGEDARERLAAAGLTGAEVEVGDGLEDRLGAFDRILVNGTLADLPDFLERALAPGGRLVGAIGTPDAGRLVVVERRADATLARRVGAALRLAPLTPGRARVL